MTITITARTPGHRSAPPDVDSVAGACAPPADAGCAPTGSAAALAGKRCPGCGETKALGEFHRDRAAKDGRASKCKPCAIATVREWRLANPERARTSQKVWTTANPERTREASRRRNRARAIRLTAGRKALRSKWMALAQEAARS